jgi:hypothetical protein
MTIQAKDVVAIFAMLILAGLLAPYILRGQVPPDVILLISGPGIGAVLAYYFGAHNGNITGLAASAVQVSNMAAQLAGQAIEKRAAPATTTVVVPPPAPAAGAPPATS